LWDEKVKVLLDLGMAVTKVNYSGSFGYGFSYEKITDLRSQISDVISVIRHLQDSLGISINDMYIMGSSYGGLIGAFVNNEISGLAGLILISPILDLRGKEIYAKMDARRTLVFYGEGDPNVLVGYDFFLEIDNNSKMDHLQNFFILRDEGHHIHRSSSWSFIFDKVKDLVHE